MSISGNYSNFSSFSRRNPSADPFYNVLTDTMNYYQTSESYNGNVNYTFGRRSNKPFPQHSPTPILKISLVVCRMQQLLVSTCRVTQLLLMCTRQWCRIV